jgi:transcriptional regulator with XRE-family HTH domain
MKQPVLEKQASEMSFGETLGKLRDAAGLTQPELATKAGVPLDSLRRWEHNRNLPRIDVAYKLAQALGVGVERLIIKRDMREAAAQAKGRRTRKPKK